MNAVDLGWLRAVRAALEVHWAERGHGSAGQCIRTTALLRHHLGGQIRGGWPHENQRPRRSGFRTPDGTWHFHYWLELGGLIIDLTADQFGADPVTVTPISDARYRTCSHAWHVAQDFRHVRSIPLPPHLARRPEGPT